jgi:2-oxo-4-hydroxy-4-carboxy--5-ureidoimidazoline (OHCU) decarboxylase
VAPAGPGSSDPGPIRMADLDRLDPAACAAALAVLFEEAPRFQARLAGARPFRDPPTLFARAREIAHALPAAEQVELIDAHPRLGASPGSVSPFSFREQGYDREAVDSAADAAADAERARVASELARLNEDYERRFGFRYCVFVAGRPLVALLPEMEAALRAGRDTELQRAVDAVIDIAADRYGASGRG